MLMLICLSCPLPAEGSVLSKGKWFKIAVTEEGIYRIDYATLKQIGLDNPSCPVLYGNNAGQLSYYNDGSAPDDLREQALYISGDDSILNEGEYILFFAQGTGRWIYDYEKKDYTWLKHNYSDTAFYFISSQSSPGKRMLTASEPTGPLDYFSVESDALFIHEKDESNLIKSGREWFQRITGITIDPGFRNIITEEGIKYNIRVAARSSVSSVFKLTEGGSERKNIGVDPVNLYDQNGTYAEISDSTGTTEVGSSSPVFKLSFYNNGEPGAWGWLDFIQLKARRSNIFDGETTEFFDSGSVSAGRIAEFTINSTAGNAEIWDVSDPFSTALVQFTRTGEKYKFRFRGDSLRRFVMFTSDRARRPFISPSPLPNQDLHSSPDADMIIVTHPLFYSYAQKLAGLHSSASGLSSLVVTPEQIYNEFSGGVPDICAIRNFVRMKYNRQKGTSRPLKYLLLFGDGSYENKTPPPGNPNFIPTYQSENSNVVVTSFTSDDFYGLLEDGEGESDGTEDIGIGRFPVSDTIEAGIMISKVRQYLDPAYMGDWKNLVCLSADDEDGNVHMQDSEGLAGILQDSVPYMNIDKIYLDAYRQSTSAEGSTYPDVNKAISNRINSGCLIFNYIGHGNESGLAHERVVRTEDISSWRNDGRLPLFITATCEFSRFDDMDINAISGKMTSRPSAGEMVLLNKEGGGIALMSTTRLVYSAPNYTLNRNIFQCAFDRDNNGDALAFGDIIRIAKNRSGNGPNKRNFTLLGDPALKLAYPWHGAVVTDSINSVPVSENTDTLKALSVITVSGHIEDPDGSLKNTFNGIVSPTVFDKTVNIKTLANDGGAIMEFGLQKNILFSGKTMARNGRFRFEFIVPRDMDYSYGAGKISYYSNDEIEDMSGYTIVVAGGFSKTVESDNEGPEIKLYMNDTLFRSGGITGRDPILIATLEDKSGINTSGSAIGHDITGWLDENHDGSFILNSYFENDLDSYTKGKISYDLLSVSQGNHSVTIKAWDNYNNSSEVTLLFLVRQDEKFLLTNLINYPNPFNNGTVIRAEHNRPDEEFDILINIYSFDGRLIKVIRTAAPASGFVLPPVKWDGTVGGGQRAGRGIYPYIITVTTKSGETAKASGRMIIF